MRLTKYTWHQMNENISWELLVKNCDTFFREIVLGGLEVNNGGYVEI